MPDMKPAAKEETMSFNDALQVLGIEDFSDEIVHSNSRGELFHCYDYIQIASLRGDKSWFRPWFLSIVKQANENWTRPESVYQHMVAILKEQYQRAKRA